MCVNMLRLILTKLADQICNCLAAVSPGQTRGLSSEFKLSLSFGLKLSCTLTDCRALSATLNMLKFLMRVDDSFLSFVVTLDDSRSR